MKEITIIIKEKNDMMPTWSEIRNPCDSCSNNPKNNRHASGICNCALPAMANPIY